MSSNTNNPCCHMCGYQIENYSKELNHVVFDESHSFDICLNCTDKFLKWQQRLYAKLFPTNAAKKRFK